MEKKSLKNKLLSTVLAAGLAGYALAPQRADATTIFSTNIGSDNYNFTIGNDSPNSINHVEFLTPFTSLDDIIGAIMPFGWKDGKSLVDFDGDGVYNVNMEFIPTVHNLGANQAGTFGVIIDTDRVGSLTDLVAQYGTSDLTGIVSGDFIKDSFSYTAPSIPTPVPEPGTMLLAGLGILGLLNYNSKKKKNNFIFN